MSLQSKISALITSIGADIKALQDGKVAKTLYDANSILIATANDTPIVLTMGASTILARLAAGDIIAATPAQLRTLLGVPPITDTKSITTRPAIANTETVIISYTCAANELAAGTTFRFKAFFSKAGTNASSAVIRIRVGTTTLIGNIAATLTPPANALAVPGEIEGLVTVVSAGAGGTIRGSLKQQVHLAAVTVQPAIAVTAAVAVDTTVANMLIELTFISGNGSNTYTFENVTLEKVVA